MVLSTLLWVAVGVGGLHLNLGSGSGAALGAIAGEAQGLVSLYGTIASRAPDGRVVELDTQFLSVRTIARRLALPVGITCAADGSLYVAETHRQRIVRLDRFTGALQTVVRGDRTIPSVPFAPYFVTFSPAGDLFFTTVTPSVGAVSFAGLWRLPAGARPEQVEQLLPPERFPDAFGLGPLAFLSEGPYAGDLLVLVWNETQPAWVARVPAPDFSTVVTFIPPEERELTFISGLAVASGGDVYITDWDGNRILRYAPDGTFRDVVDLSLQKPNQIVFDSSGTMYITTTVFGPDARSALHIVYPGGGQRVIGGVDDLYGLAVCE